ncbi:MAG TPA: transporter, partial [Flavobacteriales bacterium]|nr:transporter [Flavobacteriales bacterium]
PTCMGVYTLTVGRAISERWGAYIETYGSINDRNVADHRFDGGATLLLTPFVQLDVSGGRAWTSPTWFISSGISIRTSLFAKPKGSAK